MEEKEKEISMEELAGLIQAKEGEFIIHIEPGEEETHGETEGVSA